MKVNSDISFKGIYNNKALKKGLEFAADNGALFTASTTFALSMFARPVAIWLAPNTDKENRKIACAKSVSSSTAQLGLTFLISTPIANAIKKIDNAPQKYLSPDTVKTFKNGCKNLCDSKTYEFASQLFKLGNGLSVAAPKAVLTAACMPFIMHKLFNIQKSDKPKEDSKKNDRPSFKGKGNEKLAGSIGKVLNNKGIQKFSDKYKDSNFAMHIIAATDILNTGMFIFEAYKSKKIENTRKKALIYNAAFATGLSILCGYAADWLLNRPAEKFIQKFKEANKGMPNLDKQVRGIKIAKPVILVGGIYYMIIPFFSTALAEFADRNPHFDIPYKK